jgi:hypothetical protein
MNTLDQDDLDSAVAAGLLSPEQAQALSAHAAQRRTLPPADEEHFRLVSGFNDVFVVIASVLLLGALVSLGGPMLSALGAWGLAEFFVRRRRMALPAIVLLWAWVGSAFVLGLQMADTERGGTGLGSLAAALAAGAHWLRFRVPITVATGVLAALMASIAGLTLALPALHLMLRELLFCAGLIAFGLAMRWDMQDPQRTTSRADVAFWLHLLAAPLLVHPVFTGLEWGPQVAGAQVALVLGLYAGLALVSLLIDRRALMVSALGYVLYACAQLLQRPGMLDMGLTLTTLVISAALLVLSALWAPGRAWVLQRVPVALRQRLPPQR